MINQTGHMLTHALRFQWARPGLRAGKALQVLARTSLASAQRAGHTVVRVAGLRKPRLGVAATLLACGRAGRTCRRAGGRLGSRRPWPLVWWLNWTEKRKRQGRRSLFVPKQRPDIKRTRCCVRRAPQEIKGLAGRSYTGLVWGLLCRDNLPCHPQRNSKQGSSSRCSACG